METCVSINCPFISIYNQYNFLVDRTGGCDTQDRILEAADRLMKEKALELRKETSK